MIRVPFHRPEITDEDRAAVDAVLRSGWITSGRQVARLEDMVREITGAKFAVAVNSATSGLMLALKYLDGYMTSGPFAFSALGGHFSANACAWACPNLWPHIETADCDESLSTRGGLRVLGLEYGGHAIEHDVDALVDAAYGFTPLGKAWAKVTSLQATKPTTSAEGGMIYSDDENLAIYAREARSHGMSTASHDRKAGEGYDVVVPGGGFLFTDIQAAIAVQQLSRAEEMRRRRVAIAREYDAALVGGIEAGRVIPVPRDYSEDSVGLYAIRVIGGDNARGLVRSRLLERGVETKDHYGFLADFSAYSFLREQAERDCPLARRISREVVTLPMFSAMTDEEAESVCSALKEVLG